MSKSTSEQEARLERVIVSGDLALGRAIEQLDHAGTGILLLCDAERHLVATCTDGDIRRAILRGVSMDIACIAIANHQPLVAHAPIAPLEALHLMDHGKQVVINQLPVLDENERVVNLILRSDLTRHVESFSAVIMAGGAGTRLRPLTETLPKPLLPVGERPVMEHILEQMRQSGIERVNVTTHYLSEKIEAHFGDGSAFGVRLNYVTEDRPLGTAGGLGLFPPPKETLLVINGDILTNVDFRTMLAFHHEHNAALTVGVRPHLYTVPYGVVDTDGAEVRGIREKPEIQFLTNAGIYLLEPFVYDYIPNGERFDMPELIQALIENGQRVVSFPIIEYWLDIGQHADYERAQSDVKDGRLVR